LEKTVAELNAKLDSVHVSSVADAENKHDKEVIEGMKVKIATLLEEKKSLENFVHQEVFFSVDS
jgi:hypothetical protein